MPETSQINFSNREILEMLAKAANVSEGRWLLSVNFSFSAGNLGPTPDAVLPSAIVGIASIGLMRAQPDTPEALVFDTQKGGGSKPVRTRKT